jgi:hypothetical protein
MPKRIFRFFMASYWRERKQKLNAAEFVPKIFERGIPKNLEVIRQLMGELKIHPGIFLSAVIKEIDGRIRTENSRLAIYLNASRHSGGNRTAIRSKRNEINKLERLKQAVMSLKSELGIED